jgi:GT2 family glycosyltransferase
LIAAHNRRDTTVSCLRGFFAQAESFRPGTCDTTVDLKVVLVDDGSSDGTTEAVQIAFPERVDIVTGDGSLYWAGGMALAHAVATRTPAPDYVLWLNDDTELEPDALIRLLDVARRPGHEDAAGPIVVGALRSRRTGATTYSGATRLSKRPRNIRVVDPTSKPQKIDTFNGNIVLVPHSAFALIGGPDPVFVHGNGDHDYGYRARAAGVPCLLAPGYLGWCERNSPRGTWRDPALPTTRRIRLLLGPKGLPLRSQISFSRRHGGFLWPVWVTGGYINAFREIFHRPRSVLLPEKDTWDRPGPPEPTYESIIEYSPQGQETPFSGDQEANIDQTSLS